MTKLFIGLLSSDIALFSECIELLRRQYGPIDLESDVAPWEISRYYQEEMGSPLFRKFVFFSTLMEPDLLPSIKVFTGTIEHEFSVAAGKAHRRRINIDPGYITEAKVVLASTKDYAHRVYIGNGIYAEVTLRFNSREQSFGSLDHTYYDFRSDEYRTLFNRARGMLREALNSGA